MIRLIAAVDEHRGVANEHGIPWQGRIPSDTKYFRDRTSEGLVVMGHGTYLEFDKPLHDRENFVVSRPGSGALRPGFIAVPDATSFLNQHESELVWVIGGAALFGATVDQADELYLTQVDADFHCTKFFPEFASNFELASDAAPIVEHDVSFHFQVWRRSSGSQ